MEWTFSGRAFCTSHGATNFLHRPRLAKPRRMHLILSSLGRAALLDERVKDRHASFKLQRQVLEEFFRYIQRIRSHTCLRKAHTICNGMKSKRSTSLRVPSPFNLALSPFDLVPSFSVSFFPFQQTQPLHTTRSTLTVHINTQLPPTPQTSTSSR